MTIEKILKELNSLSELESSSLFDENDEIYFDEEILCLA